MVVLTLGAVVFGMSCVGWLVLDGFGVWPTEDRLARTVEQRPVTRLDHRHAWAHDPGELVHGDPRDERVRGEGGA